MHARARAVLAFWFGAEFEHLGAFGPVPPEKKNIWFGGGPALDQVGQRKLIGRQIIQAYRYAPRCAPSMAYRWCVSVSPPTVLCALGMYQCMSGDQRDLWLRS